MGTDSMTMIAQSPRTCAVEHQDTTESDREQRERKKDKQLWWAASDDVCGPWLPLPLQGLVMKGNFVLLVETRGRESDLMQVTQTVVLLLPESMSKNRPTKNPQSDLAITLTHAKPLLKTLPPLFMPRRRRSVLPASTTPRDKT